MIQCDPRRRRLDHGQRAHDFRSRSGGEQGDHGAVGVTDEVVAGLEQSGDELRIHLEVDPLDGRIRREPGPADNDELEPLFEGELRAPGRLASDDTAMHEYEALHRTILDL